MAQIVSKNWCCNVKTNQLQVACGKVKHYNMIHGLNSTKKINMFQQTTALQVSNDEWQVMMLGFTVIVSMLHHSSKLGIGKKFPPENVRFFMHLEFVPATVGGAGVAEENVPQLNLDSRP